MGENERNYSDSHQSSQVIGCRRRNQQTGEQKGSKSSNQGDRSDKTELFTNGGKDKIRVDNRRGQKPQLYLRVRSGETLAVKASRTNRDQGLINRPTCTLRIVVRIQK